MTVRRTRQKAGRKVRRTFSLSKDVLSALEAFRARKQIQSMTQALEEVVREWLRTKELEHLAAATTTYYDSLTAAQVDEDRAWGAFAESQWRLDEEPAP